MYKEIIEKIKPELEKTIEYLKRETRKLRTGRASPSLVEDIDVDCFGNKMSLKQLAAISVSGPRQITIQPWDDSYIQSIEEAILKSDLGSSPIVDKNIIRISLPELTEDYRKELIRLLSEKKEETRQTIRRWREEAWKEIQEKTEAGEIREDDKFKAKEDLQKLVDSYNRKAEETVEKKEKEISN
jgi:ribosome recycling factor